MGRSRWMAVAGVLCAVSLLLPGAGAQQPGGDPAGGGPTPGSRVAAVFGAARPVGSDLLILRNGDRLSGEIINPTFEVRTPYANVTLDAAAVAGIDLRQGGTELDVIVTVGDARFSGFLDFAPFELKLNSGHEVRVRPDKVRQAIFGVRPGEGQTKPGGLWLTLKNGDLIGVGAATGRLVIETSYGEVPVEVADIASLVSAEPPVSGVKIVQTNGDIVQGVLAQPEDLELELDDGGQLRVYRDRIVRLDRGARPAVSADKPAQVASPPPVAAVPPSPPPVVPPSEPAKTQPPAAPAGPDRALTLDLGGGMNMKLALIPAGRFLMGSPPEEKDRDPIEGPQREVTISRPFYMGVCEVTQGQWRALMGTTVAQQRDRISPQADLAGQGDSHPMYYVSWDEAVEFCGKLSTRTGRTVRLPSEAEWEYACRAGTRTRFCHGDDVDYGQLGDYAWYSANSGGQTWPAGQKKPNALGLHDMHGNVSEWCSDWYASHVSEASVDPQGPATGQYRVLRGGCWQYDSRSCRSAVRNGATTGSRGHAMGFRVLVEADASPPQPAQPPPVATPGAPAAAPTQPVPVPPPTGQPAIADLPALAALYPFDSMPRDLLGKADDAELTNAEYRDNALYLNGIYHYGNPNGCDVRIPVPQLNYGDWAVSLQIRLEDDTAIKGCILVGGPRYRWMTLGRERSGGPLELRLNNGSTLFRFTDASLPPKTWCSLVCSFNLKEGVVRLAYNGKVLPEVRLPAGFAVNAVGTQYEKSERVLMFTDLGRAAVHHGHVDNLAIFSRSLTAEELQTVAAAMTPPADKKP